MLYGLPVLLENYVAKYLIYAIGNHLALQGKTGCCFVLLNFHFIDLLVYAVIDVLLYILHYITVLRIVGKM